MRSFRYKHPITKQVSYSKEGLLGKTVFKTGKYEHIMHFCLNEKFTQEIIFFRNISWNEAHELCRTDGLDLDLNDLHTQSSIRNTMKKEIYNKGWHTFGQMFYVGMDSRVGTNFIVCQIQKLD